MTPLHVAAEKGHSQIVEYFVGLTDQEVDINTQDDNRVSICVFRLVQLIWYKTKAIIMCDHRYNICYQGWNIQA